MQRKRETSPVEVGKEEVEVVVVPRNSVRLSRRTGFAFEVICLYFQLVCFLIVGNPRAQRETSPELGGFVGP